VTILTIFTTGVTKVTLNSYEVFRGPLEECHRALRTLHDALINEGNPELSDPVAFAERHGVTWTKPAPPAPPKPLSLEELLS
jgi:hypothetical protein